MKGSGVCHHPTLARAVIQREPGWDAGCCWIGLFILFFFFREIYLLPLFFFFFFWFVFCFFLIFGCIGSSLLHVSFL